MRRAVGNGSHTRIIVTLVETLWTLGEDSDIIRIVV